MRLIQAGIGPIAGGCRRIKENFSGLLTDLRPTRSPCPDAPTGRGSRFDPPCMSQQSHVTFLFT
jgi:hypothetical protein